MSPLDKAIKKLVELEREADELRRFIALYQMLDRDDVAPASDNGAVSQLKGNSTLDVSNQPVDNSVFRPNRVKRNFSLGPSPKEIADLIERVIREADRPMSRGEIVDALERRDVEIHAQDKSRYVGTIAWRNKGKFVNIEGRGYWLRGEIPRAPGVPPNTPYYDPPEETSDELPLEE